jgi:hypothetical protein
MKKKSISAKIRREVILQAKGFCEYCRSNSRFSDSPFDIDHILPESGGGKSDLSNLALACHGCNLFKSNKTEFFDAVAIKPSDFLTRVLIFGTSILHGRAILAKSSD